MAQDIPERPPLKAGQKIDEATVQKLTGGGWALPKVTQVDPKTVKPIRPNPIPMESLPAEKQQELRKAMEDLTPEQEAYAQSQFGADSAEPPPPPPAMLDEDPDESPVITPEASEKQPVICPNCGWDHESKPDLPTQQDKDDFILMTLSDRPFEKTYVMFGGKASVTFRARSFEETQLIQEQLYREIHSGRLTSSDIGTAAARYHARLRELQLTCSLVKAVPRTGPAELPTVFSDEGRKRYPVVVKPGATGEPDVVIDNVVAVAHRVIFAGWPEPLYAAVYKLQYMFERATFQLIEAVGSANFWTDPARAA